MKKSLTIDPQKYQNYRNDNIDIDPKISEEIAKRDALDIAKNLRQEIKEKILEAKREFDLQT